MVQTNIDQYPYMNDCKRPDMPTLKKFSNLLPGLAAARLAGRAVS